MKEQLNNYLERLDLVNLRDSADLEGFGFDDMVCDRDIDYFEPPEIEGGGFHKNGYFPPVPVSYNSRQKKWRLEGDYSVKVADSVLKIQKGFVFDLSTIPRTFWSIIGPNELSLVAPLVHDYLYSHRGNPHPTDLEPHRTFTRLEVDRLFMALMIAEDVPVWRCAMAYRAVRAFGSLYWRMLDDVGGMNEFYKKCRQSEAVEHKV